MAVMAVMLTYQCAEMTSIALGFSIDAPKRAQLSV